MVKIEWQGKSAFEISFDNKPSRRCGDCQLCCRLLPVKELDKRGNTRCQHQKHGKGCTIYHQAGFPDSCGLWSCVWLNTPSANLKRPDHCHFVVDPIPDYIEVSENGGPMVRMNVVQVWLDPAYPEAHRDPALRAYLANAGEQHGLVGLIRLSENDAWVLFPPAMSPNGQWHERGSLRNPNDIDDHVPERSFMDFLK